MVFGGDQKFSWGDVVMAGLALVSELNLAPGQHPTLILMIIWY
jgi:hypothetical protein